MSSSPSQNQQEPSGLLHVLASVFSGVLFGMFLSRLRTSASKPSYDTRESIQPKNVSTQQEPPSTVVGLSEFLPPKADHRCPHSRTDNTPQWKKKTEIAAVVIASGLLVVNILVTIGTWKAANAAKEGVELTRRQVVESQEAIIAPEESGGFGGFSFFADRVGTVGFTLKNIGHVTAVNVTINFTAQLISLPEKRPVKEILSNKFCEPLIPVFAVGKRENVHQFTLPLSEQDRVFIKELSQTVEVTGELSYENGFGNTYKIPICSRWLETQGTSTCGNWDLAYMAVIDSRRKQKH